MSKAMYRVNVVHKGREDDYEALPPSDRMLAFRSHDAMALGFVESVRASNRREAMVLVKRMYPGHRVLAKVVKAL
jgi:hypothetical protein